jgi:RNA polymerase sigma-70 factor, ECF subfamily
MHVEDQLDPTDEQLIERVLGGETAQYELLMRRHNQRIYRAIRGVIRDDNEIEDIMQDAYVRAFAHLAEFRGAARFSTWLTRIALHEAFARVRKARRFVHGEPEETEAMEPNPEALASDSELKVVLERAIDALPESFRTVFILRAVEEMSTADTAEALAIPEDTVKTRLHRARGLLQKALVDDVSREAFGFHLSRCDRVVANVLERVSDGARTR